MNSILEKTCPVCGGELGADGNCPQCDNHKKMCLNCEFCKEHEEDSELYCRNEENLDDAMKKAKEALAEIKGFKVSELKMEPIALKKPTTKCPRWALSEKIKERFSESFH